jgi:hypothetical protein
VETSCACTRVPGGVCVSSSPRCASARSPRMGTHGNIQVAFLQAPITPRPFLHSLTRLRAACRWLLLGHRARVPARAGRGGDVGWLHAGRRTRTHARTHTNSRCPGLAPAQDPSHPPSEVPIILLPVKSTLPPTHHITITTATTLLTITMINASTQGPSKNPSYEQVCSGGSGHTEAIQVRTVHASGDEEECTYE